MYAVWNLEVGEWVVAAGDSYIRVFPTKKAADLWLKSWKAPANFLPKPVTIEAVVA